MLDSRLLPRPGDPSGPSARAPQFSILRRPTVVARTIAAHVLCEPRAAFPSCGCESQRSASRLALAAHALRDASQDRIGKRGASSLPSDEKTDVDAQARASLTARAAHLRNEASVDASPSLVLAGLILPAMVPGRAADRGKRARSVDPGCRTGARRGLLCGEPRAEPLLPSRGDAEHAEGAIADAAHMVHAPRPIEASDPGSARPIDRGARPHARSFRSRPGAGAARTGCRDDGRLRLLFDGLRDAAGPSAKRRGRLAVARSELSGEPREWLVRRVGRR